MRKNIWTIVLVVVMTIVFAGCGGAGGNSGTSDDADKNVVSHDQMVQETGIDLAAPEGCENVEYSIEEDSNGNPIAVMSFDMDGKNYCERAKSTSLTSISPKADENTNIQELTSAMNKLTEDPEVNLAGLEGKWSAGAAMDVANRDGFAFNSDNGAFIVWLDVVPGIMYNLNTDKVSDLTELQKVAEAVFLPMQGEAE